MSKAYKKMGVEKLMNHKFYTAFFCASCNAELSFYEIMHSHGCCPYCGKLSNSTVVGSHERAYKLVKIASKWWQLSKYKRVYI